MNSLSQMGGPVLDDGDDATSTVVGALILISIVITMSMAVAMQLETSIWEAQASVKVDSYTVLVDEDGDRGSEGARLKLVYAFGVDELDDVTVFYRGQLWEVPGTWTTDNPIELPCPGPDPHVNVVIDDPTIEGRHMVADHYVAPCGSRGGISKPVADFLSSCSNLACEFDGGLSVDPDGSIVRYEWDFGDGNTATGQTVTHTYASDGDYTVTLTVTDDDGQTDDTQKTVGVASGGGGSGGLDCIELKDGKDVFCTT